MGVDPSMKIGQLTVQLGSRMVFSDIWWVHFIELRLGQDYSY